MKPKHKKSSAQPSPQEQTGAHRRSSRSNDSPTPKSSSTSLPLPEGYFKSGSASQRELLLETQEIARQVEEAAAERKARKLSQAQPLVKASAGSSRPASKKNTSSSISEKSPEPPAPPTREFSTQRLVDKEGNVETLYLDKEGNIIGWTGPVAPYKCSPGPSPTN